MYHRYEGGGGAWRHVQGDEGVCVQKSDMRSIPIYKGIAMSFSVL